MARLTGEICYGLSMKRWMVLTLALLPIAMHAASPLLIVNHFADVPETSPFYDAITTLSATNILSGYSDNTFRPDAFINRAEFLKVIITTLAHPTIIETCMADNPALFKDVSTHDWYAKVVCVGKKFGVITGYPDSTFRPLTAINFAEASAILSRTFGLEGNPPEEKPWFKPFAASLLEHHAVPDTIVHFSQPLTRGEVAEMIYRLKTSTTTKTSPTYTELETWSKKPIPATLLTPTHSSSSSSSSSSSHATSSSSH